MPASMARVRLLALVSCAISCGGAASAREVDGSAEGGSGDGAPSSIADAANAADAADVAVLICGDAACGASEICVYPCGCSAVVDPPADSGCRPPLCVDQATSVGTFDCSVYDAGPACSFVNIPIPSACGRVCEAVCE
jgi:hypothetical protein